MSKILVVIALALSLIACSEKYPPRAGEQVGLLNEIIKGREGCSETAHRVYIYTGNSKTTESFFVDDPRLVEKTKQLLRKESKVLIKYVRESPRESCDYSFGVWSRMTDIEPLGS